MQVGLQAGGREGAQARGPPQGGRLGGGPPAGTHASHGRQRMGGQPRKYRSQNLLRQQSLDGRQRLRAGTGSICRRGQDQKKIVNFSAEHSLVLRPLDWWSGIPGRVWQKAEEGNIRQPVSPRSSHRTSALLQMRCLSHVTPRAITTTAASSQCASFGGSRCVLQGAQCPAATMADLRHASWWQRSAQGQDR